MIAVIFEATTRDDRKDAYLDAAARLRPLLRDYGMNERSEAPEDSEM